MLDILAAAADGSPHDINWKYLVRLAAIAAIDIVVLFAMVSMVAGSGGKGSKGGKAELSLKSMALVYLAAAIGMAMVEAFLGPHLGDLTIVAVAAVPAMLLMVFFGVGFGPAAIILAAFVGYRYALAWLLVRLGW